MEKKALDWIGGARTGWRAREEGKALGGRIEAAASSHGRNRGRRETGGSDPSPSSLSPSSERILPLMPFKKPFYAPLKTRFLSPDEERLEKRRRRKTLLVARQEVYERASERLFQGINSNSTGTGRGHPTKQTMQSSHKNAPPIPLSARALLFPFQVRDPTAPGRG